MKSICPLFACAFIRLYRLEQKIALYAGEIKSLSKERKKENLS
jgi:hypothetical protein